MDDDTIYRRAEPITPEELKNKVDNTLNRMCKEGKLSSQMASNLKVRDVSLAKIQGNPKTHKEGNQLRLIVNSRKIY